MLAFCNEAKPDKSTQKQRQGSRDGHRRHANLFRGFSAQYLE